MRNLVALSVVVGLGLLVTVVIAEDKESKYTIKQVMKMAHKDGLLKKVTSGKGTEADAKKLLELYEAMAADKPKKGDLDDWKSKTEAIVAAAKDVVEGKAGAAEALTKATNCGACHKEFK